MSDSVKELMDLASEAFPISSEIKLEVTRATGQYIAQAAPSMRPTECVAVKGADLPKALDALGNGLRAVIRQRIASLRDSATNHRKNADMIDSSLARLTSLLNEPVAATVEQPVRSIEITTQEQADAMGVGNPFRLIQQCYPAKVFTVLQPTKAAAQQCDCSPSERCPCCRE